MSKDAWKDTGDCRECRRRIYCTTACRKRKEYRDGAAVLVAAFLREKRKAREAQSNKPEEESPCAGEEKA